MEWILKLAAAGDEGLLPAGLLQFIPASGQLAKQPDADGRRGVRPKPSDDVVVSLSRKAVCDFADELKNDNHQAYAAYASAGALRLLVERHLPF